MNNDTPGDTPGLTAIQQALADASTAERCLELAQQAEAAGDPTVTVACLERAIAHDRHCQDAMLNLAAVALEHGDRVSTFSLLEEVARLSTLPNDVEQLRQTLRAEVREMPEVAPYLQLFDGGVGSPAEKPLSVLVVTGPFAAPEADDLREIVRGLLARGHQVRVLTSDTGALGAEDAAIESRVLRTLRPMRADLDQQAGRDNAARVRTAIAKSAVEFVLAGDLSALGFTVIRPAFERRVPVLHWLHGARPSFALDDLPNDPLYAIAATSDWAGTVLRNGGYETPRMPTLYPGVALGRWFSFFLPDTQRLRIACVAPLVEGSGVDNLVRALGRLHEAGVRFSAEFSGETPEPTYLAAMNELARASGIAEQVRFAPAAGRAGRMALFARTNTLVSPTPRAQAFAPTEVEAMASGLVVITCGLGGTKEVVSDGVDGLVFAPGDDVSLAEKLTQLGSDAALMARLQRAAQARAVQFSVERSVVKIETVAGEMFAARAAAESALPALEGVDLSAPLS